MSEVTVMGCVSGTPRKQRKSMNWTATEVEVLIEGVQEQYKLLFGHFSASTTQAQKKKVWADIVQKINANSKTLRDIPQAKKKWADLKSLTRKKAALQKKERSKTGGGVHEENADLSSIENKIISIIPTCQVDGVKGGLESEACELPGPDVTEVPAAEDEMARGVVSCPPPSPVAGPSTATVHVSDSDTPSTSHRTNSAEVQITTRPNKKRGKLSTSTGAEENSISQRILEVEREKLNMQRELLATQKERLSVERERLVVEREILNCLKQQTTSESQLFELSPVITF